MRAGSGPCVCVCVCVSSTAVLASLVPTVEGWPRVETGAIALRVRLCHLRLFILVEVFPVSRFGSELSLTTPRLPAHVSSMATPQPSNRGVLQVIFLSLSLAGTCPEQRLLEIEWLQKGN